jgi:hypothetical protein
MTGYQTDSAERQAALRRKVEGADGPDSKVPEHPLLTLQSQIGNAQVARLLQASHDLSVQRAGDEDELAAKHDLSIQRAGEEDELAAKHDLSIQRAGEEDELAAKHDLSIQRAGEEDELAAKHDLSIQRAGEEDELAAKHDLAQREMSEDNEQVGIDGGAVGPDTAQRIQSSRGGGSSLDTGTRASMESGFGTSFEDVRVHHDSQSDMLARRLTAHAFTTGSDIFLRGDASPSDNHLIAHELTHVVQQRSMGGGGGTMSVGAAGDAHEHQADATASEVLSNGAAPTAAAPGAQREAAPDEDQVAADHDLSLQRAAEEDENLQADHDLSVERAAAEEDEMQASHDLSLQRETSEDQSS